MLHSYNSYDNIQLENKLIEVKKMSDEPKKIEVVNGDGTDLDISDVSSHLNIGKPKLKNDEEKKQKIIIPEEKKHIENEKKQESIDYYLSMLS